jgi:diguanylate cyclase (GGDEF)-like protein
MAEAAPGWLRSGGLAPLGGRALILAVGGIVVASGPLLSLEPRAWAVLVLVSAVMVGLIAASLLVPWTRLPPDAVVAFPVAGLLAVGALGLASGRTQIAYAGLLVLTFVYAGLFLRLRTGLLLIPVAWVAYCTLVPVVDSVVLVRLVINGAAWVAITYSLSVMTAYQRRVADRLQVASRTDALTGLGNRRGLEEHLAGLDEDDCVVVCDLDHFKSVNDRGGHAAGDEMLEQFAAELRAALAPGDHAARYGGEEFVLVLRSTTIEQTLETLDALRTSWLATPGRVTFSAGVAAAGTGAAPHQVLAAADAALYAAKSAGRDCVRVAPRGVHHGVLGRPHADG